MHDDTVLVDFNNGKTMIVHDWGLPPGKTYSTSYKEEGLVAYHNSDTTNMMTRVPESVEEDDEFRVWKLNGKLVVRDWTKQRPVESRVCHIRTEVKMNLQTDENSSEVTVLEIIKSSLYQERTFEF